MSKKSLYFTCIIAFSLAKTAAFGSKKFIFTSIRKQKQSVAFLFIQTDVKGSCISTAFPKLLGGKLYFMPASNGERCGFNKTTKVIGNRTFDLKSFPQKVHPASILDKEGVIHLSKKFLYQDYDQAIKTDEKIPSVLKKRDLMNDFIDKNKKKKVIIAYMDGDEKHTLIEDFLKEEERKREAIDHSVAKDVNATRTKDYYTPSIATASAIGAGTAFYKFKGALNNKGKKKKRKDTPKKSK